MTEDLAGRPETDAAATTDAADIAAGKTLDGARDQIMDALEGRAAHHDLDDVTDELERWSIEQLLKREYHGRFLFELVQNAVDAFRLRYPERNDGLLRIVLTHRSLVVANEGEYLSPWVVIHSLSKVGQSTKPEGSSIGHKGIGFKSALEISLTPRIYSRDDPESELTLRVHYSPKAALALVRDNTDAPGWDALVRQAASRLGVPRDPNQVPVLRFPMWDDDMPDWVESVASYQGRGFNTLLVLEHDSEYDGRLGTSEETWAAGVRDTAKELSDEVLLLLGSLGTIVLEGIDDDGVRVIERDVVRRVDVPGQSGTSVSEVVLRTNGIETSRWLRFDRDGEDGAVSAETVVAARIDRGEDGSARLLPPAGTIGDAAVSLRPADYFHLFFPTLIPTGLPFLLHAYFTVDAGRTKFATGEEKTNRDRLAALRDLITDAVAWTVAAPADWAVDPSDLPNLFASAAVYGDRAGGDQQLAAEFRADLLERLDRLSWVPAVGSSGERVMATPSEVLVDGRGELDRLIRSSFDLTYPARLGVGCLPADAVGPNAVAFLAHRRKLALGDAATSFWELLLRPGETQPWTGSVWEMDRGFVSLLGLLEHWIALDRTPATSVLTGLAGDAEARIIPVIAPEGQRRRRFPPRVEHGPVAARGLVLARVVEAEDQPIPAPPDSLRVAFVRDGLLRADQIGPAADLLGIRRFDTDAVLSAVVAALGTEDRPADPMELTRFTWRLLESSISTFGVPGAMELLDGFSPGQQVWFRPGATRTDEEFARARGLAGLMLPRRSASGVVETRAGGQLVFGADWADWLEETGAPAGSPAAERVSAYRDLERAAPDVVWLLGSPAVVAEHLLGRPPAPGELAKIYAFLLRIGVWEVPPIDGFVLRTDRPEDARDPWSDLPDREAHRALADQADSGFAERQHKAVHVERDYCLLWEPTCDPPMLRALDRGVELYQACSQIRLYCSGCARHGRTPATPTPAAESYLAFTLRRLPWLRATRHGVEDPELVAPVDAWFEPGAPTGPGLMQSPYRFLLRGPEALPAKLARFLGMDSLDDADPPKIERLLLELRETFEADALAGDLRGGTDLGRTLVGLHRLCYQYLHKVDPASADGIAKRARILAASGPAMRWVAPSDARHDDGRHPVFKGLFSRGEVWFVVLKPDQISIRKSLGVPPFEVEIRKRIDGTIRDVTEAVRPFVHDLTVEFLSLLVFHSVGGPTLDLDSDEFRARARRLDALTVKRVDGLSLDVEVVDIGTVTRVGDRAGEDIYVESPTSAAPVVYHDLPGDDWPTALQSAIGPHIANVMSSDAYAATFQLLLLQPDGQRARFLLDLGIGEEETDQVRAALKLASVRTREETRRWRTVVAARLGLPSAVLASDTSWREGLTARLGTSAAVLLGAGDGAAVRSDDDPDGALAVLVEAGVDLSAVDAALQELDPTDGLRIDVAAERLAAWRGQHAREVVAVLVRGGRPAEDAISRPLAWKRAPGVRLDLDPAPDAWLAAVIADLALADLHPDPVVLADSAACSRHLASLVGLSEVELRAFYEHLTSPEGMRRLKAEHMAQWRGILRTPLVALRVRLTDPPFLIREIGEAVAAELARLPADPEAFAASLPGVMPGHPWMRQQIADLVLTSDPLHAPPADTIRALVLEIVGPDLLASVERALHGTTPEAVAELRRAMRELRAHDVQPAPVPGLEHLPVGVDRDPARRKRHITRPPRRHDQNAKDKAGRDAELLVVAAVVDRLLALDGPAHAQAIDAMVAAMHANFDDVGMRELEAAAASALLPMADEDEKVAALRSFVHVARRSDQFGFDVLGWLALDPGDTTPTPVFLEVKSSSTTEHGRRTFKASANEWDLANDPRAASYFAFCLVGRTSDGIPVIELLSRPSSIAQPDCLRVNPDTWGISYKPESQ
jgi:hypothetical protein